LLAVSIILIHVLHVPLYSGGALAGQLVEPLEHGVKYVEAGTDHCCEADHHNREIACLFGRWPGHLAELGRDVAQLLAQPVKASGLGGDASVSTSVPASALPIETPRLGGDSGLLSCWGWFFAT
jgi:hypothetical protein